MQASQYIASSSENIEHLLSAYRWAAFRISSHDTSKDILTRYTWNMTLCEALYPVLHLTEVALRNRIYDAIATVYPIASGKGKDLDCWLDAIVPILVHAEDQRNVERAKACVLRTQPLTIGRLIAELNFGFWTSMFSRDYNYHPRSGERFWPRLLPVVFPYLSPSFFQRALIAKRLNDIRKLRNRVFHHESIWDRPALAQEYNEILEVLSWMDPNLERIARTMCRFPHILLADTPSLQHRLTIWGLNQRAPWKGKPVFTGTDPTPPDSPSSYPQHTPT